ncbi:hypothetical protein SPAN111604_11270 [Sphingomonas antarctica]|uniref:hypothetical protein n=1 Tax=Sphingomonas antarctica TaxID=2040274 RepID=UPI0039E9D711
MLLDLFVRQASATQTCISSACIGSGAPAATGLRYIKAFEQKGWIIRTADPNDARRVYLSLSADLMDRLTNVLLPEWGPPDRLD